MDVQGNNKFMHVSLSSAMHQLVPRTILISM